MTRTPTARRSPTAAASGTACPSPTRSSASTTAASSSPVRRSPRATSDDPARTDAAFHTDEGTAGTGPTTAAACSRTGFCDVTGRADDVIVSGGVKMSLARSRRQSGDPGLAPGRPSRPRASGASRRSSVSRGRAPIPGCGGHHVIGTTLGPEAHPLPCCSRPASPTTPTRQARPSSIHRPRPSLG